MSGDREDPGLTPVKTRPYGLKDVGKAGFPIPPMAKWIGFEVVDGVRMLKVYVEDIALQHLDPTARGASRINTLEVHRNEIFKIAAKKYERGLIDFGGVIRVAYADVARQPG
jgi:hypothetical protein